MTLFPTDRVLSALSDSTLSAAGVAGKLTPGSTAEIPWEVVETLSHLVEQGVLRSFEAGGVTWYEAVQQRPTTPTPTVAAVRANVDALQAFRDSVASVSGAAVGVLEDALTPEAAEHVKAARLALHTARERLEKARIAERLVGIRLAQATHPNR